ncbi:Cysteine-rich receptor-like protein kinase 29, partial [Cucurbita argyrosperma subsp. sororia]
MMEMGSFSLGRIFYLALVIAQLMSTTISQPEFLSHKCSENANYTNNSPFKKNLDKVLALITSNSHTDTRVDYGFYNATFGEDPDTANAKVLCRKGVPLEDCRSCVKESAIRIVQDCPNQKEGVGWYSNCQILYSNNSVHGEISINSASRIAYNAAQAPDAISFNEKRRELLDRLREEAASGTSIRKSAGGDVKLESPNTYTIYGLVDCFPDMSYFNCDVCLSRLQSNLPSCCNGSIGARLTVTSCQINYEIHPLYAALLSPPPPLPPPSAPNLLPPSSPSTLENNGNTTRTVIIVVVSIVSAIIIIVGICIVARWRKRKHRRPLQNLEKNANYTNNSPFKKNLENALALITSNSNTDTRVDYGFYNATFGEAPDTANAKALCRKGVPLEDCRSCVNDSARRIVQNCPNQKEGAGWYHHCQILYSNNSVHGEITINSAPQIAFNTAQAPDANSFNEERRELLDRLREEAALGSSIRKSAGGDVKLANPNTYTIYGLVDCFPDMSYFDCDVCLSRLQSNLPSCCNGSIGARLIVTSCQINYEIHPLYAALLSPPLPPPSSPNLLPPSSTSTPESNGYTARTVIIVAVSIASAIILIVGICIVARLRKRKHKRSLQRLETVTHGDATDEISIPSRPGFFMHSITGESNTMVKSDGGSHSEARSLQNSDNDASISELFPR